MKRISVRRLTLLALWAAVAVVLSWLESRLPLAPFLPPGAKAGLSNVVVMFLAAEVSLPAALAVAAFKALFALVTRGAVAALMSAAGGLLSATALWLAARSRLGCLGLGVTGAIVHNAAQLGAAALLAGPAVAWYAPALLLTGLASGGITALLLWFLAPRMGTLWKER